MDHTILLYQFSTLPWWLAWIVVGFFLYFITLYSSSSRLSKNWLKIIYWACKREDSAWLGAFWRPEDTVCFGTTQNVVSSSCRLAVFGLNFILALVLQYGTVLASPGMTAHSTWSMFNIHRRNCAHIYSTCSTGIVVLVVAGHQSPVTSHQSPITTQFS